MTDAREGAHSGLPSKVGASPSVVRPALVHTCATPQLKYE